MVVTAGFGGFGLHVWAEAFLLDEEQTRCPAGRVQIPNGAASCTPRGDVDGLAARNPTWAWLNRWKN
jgi:hypothetical protein